MLLGSKTRMANFTTPPQPGQLQRILIGRDPKRTLIRTVIWVILLLVIWKYALVPVRVHGISMLPTYNENGVNVINRLAYRVSEPRRGDVVAIRPPAGERIMYPEAHHRLAGRKRRV